MSREVVSGKIETPTDPNENRRANELEYVLFHLRQAREEVIRYPRHFETDALEKIEKAITKIEDSKRAEPNTR
jgi:hypothetical protein